MAVARALSRLKGLVVPRGRAPRRIRGGLTRGLVLDLDLQVHTQLLLGLYEQEIATWTRRLSRDARSAMDIGAAEGTYTLFFMARCPTQRVFAFEPSMERRAVLRRNLALNGLDHDPRLELSDSPVGSGAGDVPLDAMFDRLELPCVMKIDVEGAELGVLESGPKTLNSPGVSWIIETHSLELENECIAMFRKAKLRTTIVDNAW